MKKISIAFLAAMSIASFGCKKKGGGDALAKMTEFKDKMCKCADKACTDKVTEEMTKWGQDMAKEAGDKPAAPSEDDAKKLASITEEMTKCMTKAMMAGAPTPPAPTPAAPPAGGDKPADPAAAPPAGGDKPADPAAAPPAGGDKPAAGSN